MIDQFKIDSYGCRVWCSIMNQRWLRVKSLVSWAPCRECLLFKRLRDMVLISGQNDVLYCYCLLMLRNNVCFRSSNYRWAPCRLKVQSHGPIENRQVSENPLVGRHVGNSLRISNMASRGKTHTFGRHVGNVRLRKG